MNKRDRFSSIVPSSWCGDSDIWSIFDKVFEGIDEDMFTTEVVYVPAVADNVLVDQPIAEWKGLIREIRDAEGSSDRKEKLEGLIDWLTVCQYQAERKEGAERKWKNVYQKPKRTE